MASAGDVLIQRFRAVEAAALEEGRWSLARHLELLPEAAVSTVSSGLRGVMIKAERDSLRLRQSLRIRSPRPWPATIVGGARWKKKNPEQIGRGSGRNEDREGTTPHETSNGGTKPEEGKARAKENEACS